MVGYSVTRRLFSATSIYLSRCVYFGPPSSSYRRSLPVAKVRQSKSSGWLPAKLASLLARTNSPARSALQPIAHAESFLGACRIQPTPSPAYLIPNVATLLDVRERETRFFHDNCPSVTLRREIDRPRTLFSSQTSRRLRTSTRNVLALFFGHF